MRQCGATVIVYLQGQRVDDTWTLTAMNAVEVTLRDAVMERIILRHRAEYEERKGLGLVHSEEDARDVAELFFWETKLPYQTTSNSRLCKFWSLQGALYLEVLGQKKQCSSIRAGQAVAAP